MSLILQQRIRQHKNPPVKKPNVPKQRAQIKTQPIKPLQKREQKVVQKREEKKVHYEEQKEEEQKEEGQEGEIIEPIPVTDISQPIDELELSDETIHIVSISSDESSSLDTDVYNTEEDIPYFDQHNIIIGNFIESSDNSVELNYHDTYELSSQVSMGDTPTFDELDTSEDADVDYNNIYITPSDVFTMDASYDSMISTNYTLY